MEVQKLNNHENIFDGTNSLDCKCDPLEPK